MKLFSFRENYLEWDEFQTLMQEREQISFMHNTAIQSLKNKTKKQAEQDDN